MDKISPFQIIGLTVKRLMQHPKRTGVLFALLACFYVLEDVVVGDIPPDPFTWLLLGLPSMLLCVALAVVVFYNLLPKPVNGNRFFPYSFFKKYILFFLCVAVLQVVCSTAPFILSILALPIAGVVGAKESIKVVILALAFILLIPAGYLIVKRILIFPAIIAGDDSPFRRSGLLMRGHVIRFVFSILLVCLPFVAAQLPFILQGGVIS